MSTKSTSSPAEAHDYVRDAFAEYARDIERWRRTRSGYFSQLRQRYRFLVEPDARVLELGVGTGDLLASLDAGRAVGVDICEQMLQCARARYPSLELHHAAAEDLSSIEGPFDYIILSDLTVFLHDILAVFRGLHRLCHPRTRVITNHHSRAWQPLLDGLSAIGLKHRQPRTNWLTVDDVCGLFALAGFEVIKRDATTLLPAAIPLVGPLANRYLFRLPVVRHACLVNWVVARPRAPLAPLDELSVSIVCPCRDEAGHIAEIVDRTPHIGSSTELIFVEGNSSDGTWEAIQREVAHQRRGDLKISAYRQPGHGKGDAVRVGFAHATGEVLAILDADLTVLPEVLPDFVRVLSEGLGELINGSRMVYPMDDEAMRFLNVLGNKFFARAFSYLLDQPLKDTLCGTKVLTRADYQRLARGRSYFGDFDPFGDFDLLFGAAKLNLKIVELPIRYKDRRYGATSIDRVRDGRLLLRMCGVALRRLKFCG